MDTGLAVGPTSSTEMTLGHNVESKAEVDALMEQAGPQAPPSSSPLMTHSGVAIQGYFQDPDGHLWEVVWNPQWSE